MTMDRTAAYGGGGGHCPVGTPPAQVPIGWQRRIHHGGVVYISPGGSLLGSVQQAARYLQTDGTCKCGLECPLILHKVFNFDPGAAVSRRTAADVEADSAVTKLCIHRRKLLAVATLRGSLQAQRSGRCLIGSLNPALRMDVCHDPHDPRPHDGPYTLPPLGSPPRRDPYGPQARLRPPDPNHAAQRSPYRGNHHSLLLSPPATTPTPTPSPSPAPAPTPAPTPTPQHYGDRSPFLRSPEGFHGALSPGPAHLNGERYGPPPPRSCARAPPAATPRSPDYAPDGPPPLPQHPAPYLVRQRSRTSSETDPLGILDPIPGLSDPQSPAPAEPPRRRGPPPAVVPLPSNLPMPAGKTAGPGPGAQRHPALAPPPPAAGLPPVRLADPRRPASASLCPPGAPSPSWVPLHRPARSVIQPPHRAPGPAGPGLDPPGPPRPPSFPASSLLSAAATAQLQNPRPPGPVGGGRPPYGPQGPPYPRGPAAPPSGRAALRDKLMSPQRAPPPPPRKRKPPGGADGGGAFPLALPRGPRAHGCPEPGKRPLQRAGGSMAPLGAQNGLNHAGRPPPPGQMQLFQEGVPPLATPHGPAHLIPDLPGRGGGGEPFARQGNPAQNRPFLGNLRTFRCGGPEGGPGPLGPQAGPPQGGLGFRDGPGFPPLMSNGGFQMYPEPGTARFLEPPPRKLQNGGQRRRPQKQPPRDASGPLPVPAEDFLPCPDSLSCRDSGLHPRPPGAPNGLLRPFKESLAQGAMNPAGVDQPRAAGLPDALGFQACQRARGAQQTPAGQGVWAGPGGEPASSVIVRNCAFPAPPAELPQPVPNGSPGPPYPGEPPRTPRTPAKPRPSNGASASPEALLHLGRSAPWGPGANGGPPYGPGQNQRGPPPPPRAPGAPGAGGDCFYGDFLSRQAFPGPRGPGPPALNGTHHRNGQPGRPRGPPPAGIIVRSPEQSPAPEGRQAFPPKRSNGFRSGPLGEGGLGGSFLLHTAGGRTGQEGLLEPGRLQPLPHPQGRPPAQPGGDLLWAAHPTFHPWTGEMKMEGPSYLCSVREMMQSEAQPVRFHQTCEDELDPQHKARGLHLRAGAVEDHMEDVLHNAMGQWHTFTANVGLDVVRKAPKAKKSKIFR